MNDLHELKTDIDPDQGFRALCSCGWFSKWLPVPTLFVEQFKIAHLLEQRAAIIVHSSRTGEPRVVMVHGRGKLTA